MPQIAGEVRRRTWGARKPKVRLPRLAGYLLRRRRWTVHYSAGCPGNRTGPEILRAIQAFHMDKPPKGRGWWDIAYNYVIAPAGPGQRWVVYRGRGFGRRSAANGTTLANSRYQAVCVIGADSCQPPEWALEALDDFLEDVGAKIVKGHGEHVWTHCPGKRLRAYVASWSPSQPPS